MSIAEGVIYGSFLVSAILFSLDLAYDFGAASLKDQFVSKPLKDVPKRKNTLRK